jgi:peptidoglycan/LPS O-acetylase OafA/YrhL
LPKAKSLVSIDILRALAALGVFYYHLHIGGLLARYSGMNWLQSTDSFGAVYAVPLFFLISGYCIHLSNIKYLKNNQALPLKEYYRRRFLRIYPPYLTALVFSIAVNFITDPNASVGTADLFAHIFLLQGFTVAYFNTINVVLWTISVEMAFYILYPVFYYLRSRFSLNHALLFSLSISCISILFFSIKGSMSNPERFCVFNIWFAWCSGAFLADKVVFDPSSLKKPVYVTLYCMIAAGFIALKLFPQPWLAALDYQFDILIWAAPMIIIISNEKWFANNRSIVLKLFSTIGLSSYSLYLFHEPLIALKNYLAHAILPLKIQPAGMLLGFLLIPLITWFGFLYIEKPFLARGQKTVTDAEPLPNTVST